ncbi:MFS transporter [Thalassospira sp. MCCC 1A01428]|uniref:MFS transporter n=1 Tax=Thalassospira sp. MCCC 1A01428 TaxID=1470575 RepID=UPI000A260A15|nr:MFS transporter [Thalassospira sp. MCCC 1A01428]OSQ43142.1 hypothetical protein THS27_12225 [Thalassospira sp. MCCC 1A01428]
MTIRETLRPLSNTGFAWYLAGNTGSIVGTWAQRVALLWIAWELTESTTVLGLLAMADLLPSVAIAPLAGTIADRYNRLSLAKMLQWVSVLPPMLLLGLSLSGQLRIEWIVAVAVATGVINGFDHPIRMVLVGSLVERARVGGAVALNSMTFNLARMIGPVFGGLAIAEKLFWPLFLFNCLSYIGFATILARLKSSTVPQKATEHMVATVNWSAVFCSLKSVQKYLLAYFLLIALCFRPVFELLPALAEKLNVYGVTAADGFSTLTFFQGFGATIGAVSVSFLLPRFSPLYLIIASGGGALVGMTLFLSFDGLYMAAICLAMLSGAILANGIVTQVVLQTGVPDHVRGRVLSLYTMIFRGIPALGALLIGILADAVSLHVLFLAGCPLVLAMTFVIARLNPQSLTEREV